MYLNVGECDVSTSANRIHMWRLRGRTMTTSAPKGPYGWQPVMLGTCRPAERGQFESVRPLELREKKNAY